MKSNSLENQLIEEALRESNNNLSLVARSLGISYHALKDRAERVAPTYDVSFPRATTPEPDDITTLGKPGLERYVIAVKPRGSAWSTKYDAVIADARKKFDAGTHDMFQGSYQGWVVQYLIPLMHVRRPCRFFADMVVMR